MAGINYNPTPYYYAGYNVGVTGTPNVTGTPGVTNVPTGTPNATMGAPTGTVDAFENMNWLATMNKVTISNNVTGTPGVTNVPTGTPNASIGAPTATPTATAVAPTGTQAVNTSGSKRTPYINTNPTLGQTQTPGAPGSCPTPTPEPTIGAPTGTPTPTIGAPTGTPTVSIIPGLTPLPKGCGDGNPRPSLDPRNEDLNWLCYARIDTTSLMNFIDECLSGSGKYTREGSLQFAEMLQSAFDKYNLKNKYDKEAFLDCVIKIIIDRLGVEENDPSSIFKGRQALRESGIWETFKSVLNSVALEKMYFCPDGEIGDFKQGLPGDCWLLSGLSALSASEQGRQYIKEAIKDNGDGTYTVTFKEYENAGNIYEPWSGTITYDDIVKARSLGKYASGDPDVLLFELALEKCWRERGSDGETAVVLGAADSYFIIGALTGCIVPEFRGLSKENLFKYKYDDFKNGDIVMTCSQFENEYVTDVYGNQVKLISGHAYAIVDMYQDKNDPSKNTVTLINPHDSSKPIVLSWDVFNQTKGEVACYCSIDVIDIDDIFAPYLNGDIGFDDLSGTFSNLSSQGVFSDEQKEEILAKAESLGLESLEIYWIKRLLYR